MISIDCTHPDLEEFIDIKKDLTKITKANISIKMNDKFMNAVKENTDFNLEFIIQTTGDTINKNIKARKLFRKIAENNWAVGEPAMLFWDNINSWNLLSEDDNFEYAGVNPCAEESLPAGGSCLLGSINLSEFVKNNNFDFKNFETAVRLGVRFLNELLIEGLPLHPLQEQKDSVEQWRQIGLGIMGLADLFIKLSLKYGSQYSLDLIDKIGYLMINTAIQESALIAKEMGKYPNFSDKVLESRFFIQNTSQKTKDIVKEYGLANSQLLTCAPTGTLSTMLGISGGIEPIYSYSYTRKTESLHDKDREYKIYTPIVESYIKNNNLNSEDDLPDYFTNALLLNYLDRIKVQAAWQKYIDASISSTVNLSENATVEDIEKIYLSAWENKLKGITVFRNNCDRTGILNINNKKLPTKVKDLPYGTTIQMSNDLIGKKRKIITGCGTLHIMAWFDPMDGKLMEVYLSKGSDGGCNSYMVGLSRIISAAMRTGLSFDIMVDQLKSVISCPSYTVRTATKKDTSKGKCCPDAIANSLIDMKNEVNNELGLSDDDLIDTIEIKNNICVQCGTELKYEEGCITCPNCGWSKCG